MIPLCIFACLLALSATAEGGPEGNPAYRWLTTSELDALLRGSLIVEDADWPPYMKIPEAFLRDGSHVRYADNFEAHGKYAFRDNMVCDQESGHDEVCRRVLIDNRGQYWIVNRGVPRRLTRILVKPIK